MAVFCKLLKTNEASFTMKMYPIYFNMVKHLTYISRQYFNVSYLRM